MHTPSHQENQVPWLETTETESTAAAAAYHKECKKKASSRERERKKGPESSEVSSRAREPRMSKVETPVRENNTNMPLHSGNPQNGRTRVTDFLFEVVLNAAMAISCIAPVVLDNSGRRMTSVGCVPARIPPLTAARTRCRLTTTVQCVRGSVKVRRYVRRSVAAVVGISPLRRWRCLRRIGIGRDHGFLDGPNTGFGLPRRRVRLDPTGRRSTGVLIPTNISKLWLRPVRAALPEPLQNLLRRDLAVGVVQCLITKHIDELIWDLERVLV